LNWKNGSRDPKQIQLPVSKEVWASGVKLSFKASTVGVGGWMLTLKNIGLSVSVTAIGSAVQRK
jgi:hypothetical protein